MPGPYLCLLACALALPPGRACAQAAPPADAAQPGARLRVPQVEGERHGTIVGRAVACGLDRARTEAVLRRARADMQAAVGARFTEERYLPALDRAIAFEAGLGRPSEAACTRALDAFARFEAEP